MSPDITTSPDGERGAELYIENILEKSISEPTVPRMPSPTDDFENGLSRVPSEAPYSIFSTSTRAFIIFMVSISALISPLAATIYYPALNPLAAQLHVSNSAITLSITTFMILQAIAPAFVATMSDTAGRRLSFIICFSIFLVGNVGLALQTNYVALLVLRAVQSSGSSPAIALSMAVVADVATSAERGRYMGYAQSGLLLGPAFGPLLGGALAQFLGWRSIFWFLAIFSASFLVLFTALFPETCRKVVGNGSIPPRGIALSLLGYIQQRKRASSTSEEEAARTVAAAKTKKVPNPLAVLRILIDKESRLLLLYNAFIITGQMVITASLPTMLLQTYGYDTLKVGLCFLPLGCGALTSSLTQGHLVDWNFRRHARLCNIELRKGRQQDLREFPLEMARCQMALPNSVLAILGMLAFGWVMEYRTHIAGPEVVLFFVGFSVSGAFNVSNAFIIDLHRDGPATATAAVNLTRCLISAGGVSVIVPMINAMGRGWAFSFVAFVYVALLPVLWVLMKFGPKWRAQKMDEEKRKEQEKVAEERQEERQENVRCSGESKEKDIDV